MAATLTQIMKSKKIKLEKCYTIETIYENLEDNEYITYILNANYVQTSNSTQGVIKGSQYMLPEVVPSYLVWTFEISPFARTPIQI